MFQHTQTIFCDLPRLTGLTDRELVQPSVFEGILSSCIGKLGMRLLNSDDRLSASKPSYWLEGLFIASEGLIWPILSSTKVTVLYGTVLMGYSRGRDTITTYICPL